MKPEETNRQENDTPILPQRSISVNPIPKNEASERLQNQEAAANVIRSQINNILDKQASSADQLETANPYFRDHEEHVDPQAEKWREYHTAWQNYYQKYYEGYYLHSLKNAQSKLQEQYKGQQLRETPTKEEEMFDLRQKLIGKVKNSATKIHKSRHFLPILAGLLAVLIFLFMQYNQLVIANIMAYVSPGNIDPQNIILDPSSEITVAPDPKLIIPKINIDVPVIYNISNDYDTQMEAMSRGVAHFAIPGADSHPGEIGNTVIAGHSSSDLFDNGKYKFIFAQLDKLEVGDIIYANYNSVRYTYTVTKKEVVKPTDVDKLVYSTNVPVLTLITCTPLGTAISRLLVTAEQVSPDPAKATAATTTTAESGSTTSIPGTTQTLLEKLFGNN